MKNVLLLISTNKTNFNQPPKRGHNSNNMKTIRLSVSDETLKLLKEIEIETGLKKSAVYASCLSIGAKLELEKINQLKTKSNENNN